jgi:hypothetical protein
MHMKSPSITGAAPAVPVPAVPAVAAPEAPPEPPEPPVVPSVPPPLPPLPLPLLEPAELLPPPPAVVPAELPALPGAPAPASTGCSSLHALSATLTEKPTRRAEAIRFMETVLPRCVDGRGGSIV